MIQTCSIIYKAQKIKPLLTFYDKNIKLIEKGVRKNL